MIRFRTGLLLSLRFRFRVEAEQDVIRRPEAAALEEAREKDRKQRLAPVTEKVRGAMDCWWNPPQAGRGGGRDGGK